MRRARRERPSWRGARTATCASSSRSTAATAAPRAPPSRPRTSASCWPRASRSRSSTTASRCWPLPAATGRTCTACSSSRGRRAPRRSPRSPRRSWRCSARSRASRWPRAAARRRRPARPSSRPSCRACSRTTPGATPPSRRPSARCSHMAEPQRPAWSRGESVFADSAQLDALPGLSPEWAWGGSTGRGIRVAIVDSGVEASHPDVGDCVDADAGVALRLGDDGEVVEETGPHSDLYGHGTACAGIIHALAPEARVTSVRVLGEGLTGKSPVFLRGLGWAVEQGFDVINLSLGATRRDWALAFYELCDTAYFKGSFVVTAANNFQQRSFPSLYGTVASVACNTATDPMEYYANPNPPTEFLARGIDVEVAWKDGARITVTGNSFAAPHISALAALVRAKHPSLTPSLVKAVLWGCAANVRRSLDVVDPMGNVSGVLDLSRLVSSPRGQSGVFKLR